MIKRSASKTTQSLMLPAGRDLYIPALIIRLYCGGSATLLRCSIIQTSYLEGDVVALRRFLL